MTQPTAASWLMVATLGLTWGATFLVTEIALKGITPFWLASARMVIGSALTIAVWGITGGKINPTHDSLRRWPYILVVGVLSSALPFALLAWGQQYVTAGFAGVSMAAVALIVLPLAHLLIPGERLTLQKTVGFLIGFVGVCVLIGASAFDSTGAEMETWGRFACLGAASCYAVSSIILRRCPPIDPIALAALLILTGALVSVPFAYVAEGWPPMPDTETLWVLAGLGLIPTAAANLLRILVIRTAGPVFMSLTNYQVPLWSVILGSFFLGEAFPPSLGLAMVLILTGVALSQWGALRQIIGR